MSATDGNGNLLLYRVATAEKQIELLDRNKAAIYVERQVQDLEKDKADVTDVSALKADLADVKATLTRLLVTIAVAALVFAAGVAQLALSH